MGDFFFKTVRVLEPVLVHFLVANLISMISNAMGLHADAAFLTLITAVLVLPLFLQMLKNDQYARGEPQERSLSLQECGKIAGLGVVSNLALTTVLNLILVHFQFSNEVQEGLFSSNILVQMIGLGVIVPWMEEVAFRGLVYNRLKDYNKKWPAALIAAAMFAVYHGNAVQILFAFPMALIIIGVYQRWNTLRAAVIFHMAVNVSSILITVLGR